MNLGDDFDTGFWHRTINIKGEQIQYVTDRILYPVSRNGEVPQNYTRKVIEYSIIQGDNQSKGVFSYIIHPAEKFLVMHLRSAISKISDNPAPILKGNDVVKSDNIIRDLSVYHYYSAVINDLMFNYGASELFTKTYSFLNPATKYWLIHLCGEYVETDIGINLNSDNLQIRINDDVDPSHYPDIFYSALHLLRNESINKIKINYLSL